MHSILQKSIVSDAYRPPIQFVLALQIPIAIFCLLMLDGGLMARACAIAMAAHWMGILLIMFRRPETPKHSDIAFLRIGFLLLFVPIVIVMEFLR